MGFDWDEYKGGGGNFISAAEKKVMADNGIPFKVTNVRGPIFKFENENYELDILAPDPESGDEEERILSFPIGSGADSRDRMLAGLQKYLKDVDEPVVAKLTKIGRAYFIEQA